MVLLENVHSHWHFVKPVPFTLAVIDLILLLKEPAVVKTRERPIKLSIEPPSQSALMEKVKGISEPIER